MIRILIICIFLPLSVIADDVTHQGSLDIEKKSNVASIELDIRQTELRKLEAERYKLELEAREISQRLSANWWADQRITQYLIAIIISAALLFGWVKAYLQPIIRKETEINDLTSKVNATFNSLLEAQNKSIRAEQEKITKERDELSEEKIRLETESKELKEKQIVLGHIVGGLKSLVQGSDEKYFSILNAGDPISKLEQYGWKLWSDNYFGWLGYYLIIENDLVEPKLRIIVGREFEIEEIKQDSTKNWRNNIEHLLEHPGGGSLLALDYSYLGLAVDDDAPVGGVLYLDGGKDKEFYAPFKEWSVRLSAILNE